MRIRKYVPGRGVFTSPDPLWMLTPDASSYHYGLHDPVNTLDPWGLGETPTFGGIGSPLISGSPGGYYEDWYYDEGELASPLTPGRKQGWRRRTGFDEGGWSINEDALPLDFSRFNWFGSGGVEVVVVIRQHRVSQLNPIPGRIQGRWLRLFRMGVVQIFLWPQCTYTSSLVVEAP
jgi:hypothetical protein